MKKNAVAHFEIYGKEPDALAKFYTSLFDWQVETVPGMDYRLIKSVETSEKGMPTQAGGINGGLLKSPDGFNASAWINYVTVDSVDASIERAKGLGAKVTRTRTPVPGMGWFGMLIDPQGNHFAVWEADHNAK